MSNQKVIELLEEAITILKAPGPLPPGGGSPASPFPPSDLGPKPTPTGKRIVQEVGGHGIMCMKLLSNGQVLFGEYSGRATSKLWCLGIKTPIATIKTGESVFRICEDRGRVYLALENYKIVWGILRDNPRLLKFPNVKKLDPGPHDGAWDIKRVNDKLILLGGGEIVVDGKQVRTWKKRYYCKQIVHYVGSPLIIGWNKTHENAGWLGGKGWKWLDKTPRGSQARFMAGTTNLSRKKMYLVGTDNYKDGKHHSNSAALWTYTGGKLSKARIFKGFDYSSCVEMGPNGKVYFLLTRRWKKHIHGAKLMELSGSKLRSIVPFDESEGRAIVFKDGNILVATRSHGTRGRVYEIGGVL